MKKCLYLFLALLQANNAIADSEYNNQFGLVDAEYLEDLSACKTSTREHKFNIGETEYVIKQEIKSLEKDKCQIQTAISGEHKFSCTLNSEQLNIIVSYYKNKEKYQEDYLSVVSNSDNCTFLQENIETSFSDVMGVEFGCDVLMSVQMVSPEECVKCRNRELLEDKKIKLSGKPLTYCALIKCPDGYTRHPNGECKKTLTNI